MVQSFARVLRSKGSPASHKTCEQEGLIEQSERMGACGDSTGKGVNSGEGSGWPLPSTGMGTKKGGYSSKGSVRGMTASPSLSKQAGESEGCDKKPQPVKEPETS